MIAKNQAWTISLISVLYTCGIVAIGFNIFKEEILPGTSILLLLSCLAIVFSYTKITGHLLGYILFAFVIGLVTEIIGVNTGLLFGTYSYSSILGPKLFNVPLIIGLNWVMLSLIGMSWASKLKISWWWKSLLVSIVMVLLDFIIEPVAIKLNYWSWHESTAVTAAPLSNYLWWLVIAFVINTIGYTAFRFTKKNDVAAALFVLLLCFFVSLNFIL